MDMSDRGTMDVSETPSSHNKETKVQRNKRRREQYSNVTDEVRNERNKRRRESTHPRKKGIEILDL